MNRRITWAGMVQPASKLSQVGVGRCIAAARRGAPCSPYKSTRISRTRRANSHRSFVPFSMVRHPVRSRLHAVSPQGEQLSGLLCQSCNPIAIFFLIMAYSGTTCIHVCDHDFNAKCSLVAGPMAPAMGYPGAPISRRGAGISRLEGDDVEVSPRGRAEACRPFMESPPASAIRPNARSPRCFPRLSGVSPSSWVSSASPHYRGRGAMPGLQRGP